MLALLFAALLQDPAPEAAPPPRSPRAEARAAREAARARQRELEQAQRILTVVFQTDRMEDLGRDELSGRLLAFDRDEDAALSVEELRTVAAWSPLRPRREAEEWKAEDALALLLRVADRGGDGALAHEELLAFFDARDLDHDGVLRRNERADGPNIGEKAPDFALAAPGGEELESLSALLKRGKPVALLFGSYT